VQQVVDLSVFPWPWEDMSIDGIYASHLIEHLPFDQQDIFILECYRILKKGGFLRFNLPHSSCVTAIGCYGHYRTFSYNTMDGYLGMDFYRFGKAKWQTVEKKLLFWYEVCDAQGELPLWIFWLLKIVDPIMNFMIRLVTPRIFENVFCPAIQCREVIWKGIKL